MLKSLARPLGVMIVLLFIAGADRALATSSMGGHERHMGWWEGGWISMFFGPFLVMLLFLVFLGVAAMFVGWLGGTWIDKLWPSSKTTLEGFQNHSVHGETDEARFKEQRQALKE